MSSKPDQVALPPDINLEGLSTIEFTVEFQAICSVPKKPYGGKVHIKYIPAEDRLIEWNSFQEWVRTLRDETFLAEELVCRILQEAYSLAEPEWVQARMEITSEFHLPVTITAWKFNEDYGTVPAVVEVMESC